jgi:hypothetical protein
MGVGTGHRMLLASLPAAGGAGLVAYVVAGASLPLAVATVALIGAAAWTAAMRAVSEPVRRRLRARLRAGAAAGLVATLAYDSVRYGVVALFSLSFEPFHVLPIFGRLFVGTSAPEGLAVVVGLAYHLANGIGFGIAYALIVRRPSIATGVAWGIGLELCMALLYPSWLRIVALREFLAVSAIGHVVYGGVLGGRLARRGQEVRA